MSIEQFNQQRSIFFFLIRSMSDQTDGQRPFSLSICQLERQIDSHFSDGHEQDNDDET